MELIDWFRANPVALGAIIGAGGSVLAQLIAAFVNSLAAGKRAKQERAERAIDRAVAERERFDAARREAFVDILQRVSNIGFTLSNLPDSRTLIQTEIDLEELAQRIEVVSLLAPSVYPVVVHAHRQLAIVRDQIADGQTLDSPQAWWQEFREQYLNPLRVSMRDALAARELTGPEQRRVAGRSRPSISSEREGRS